MSGPLAMSLIGGIAGVAVLCCLLGMVRTLRIPHTPPSSSVSSPEETARVICSACHGGLSGLESHCPTCGKRLRYQVPASPSQKGEANRGTR